MAPSAAIRPLEARDAALAEKARMLAALDRELSAKERLVHQQAMQLEEQKAEIAKISAERDLAFQLAFRKKAERYLPDPKQFILDFGDAPDVVDAAEGIADAAEEQVAGYGRRRRNDRKPRNEQLPPHLPRYEVTLDVPEDQKTCPAHGERQVIGYDRFETLEIIPISLRVRVTLVPKLACPGGPECGVVDSIAAARTRRRKQVRHERGGRDHGCEVWVPCADHRHRRYDGHAGHQRRPASIRFRNPEERPRPRSDRGSAGGRSWQHHGADVGIPECHRTTQHLRLHGRPAIGSSAAPKRGPVWERMREYLASDTIASVMPKEGFGKAVTYLRNQFEHLLVYLDYGLMPIDNNETEHLMKHVALGRKNWLFVGSVDAGYRAADLMTLVSSAVRNDLDVFAYVKAVLDRLLAGCTDYEALRPDAWWQTHPEAIRAYRVEERLARADAKSVKRAKRRVMVRR